MNNTKQYLQFPLKIRLDSHSSWVGTSTYTLLIDDLSSITFSHDKRDRLLRQITPEEQVDLINLIKNIEIPFTGGDFLEGIVCDGGGFDVEIKCKSYKIRFTFYDGQDEVANKSVIDLVNYIYNLLDTSDIDLSFGSLNN